MNVVFISNSTSKASNKARAVLDAYATRIGDTAWATPITEEALAEVQRMLKQGISRYTSVACYRNRGSGSLVLTWVVGNRHHYDNYGRFAPETRARRNVFSMHYRHAALIAGIAGYSHDFGKSSGQFQFKIGNDSRPCTDPSDGIRHEWISAWIFKELTSQAGKGLPETMSRWGSAMASVIDKGWMPLEGCIESARDAVTVLVATHHQAFGYGDIRGQSDRRSLDRTSRNSAHVKAPSLDFDKKKRLRSIAVPLDDKEWTAHGQSILRELSRLDGIHDGDPDYWHGVSLIARASLLLSDHEVSAIDMTAETARSKPRLYANTTKNGTVLNQDLIWHLKNVGDTAKRNVGMFANRDLPVLPPETIEKIMARSASIQYQWQDRACDTLPKGPALVFNVASTGAGKTRGNVKMACALRDGRNVRISSAFNLRSLTLQTHDAYCDELGLAKDMECACLVGDPIVREIHESFRDDDITRSADVSGCETGLNVMGAENLLLPAWLEREINRVSGKGIHRSRDLKKIIGSPVLVSTIDYLNAAGDMTKPNADHAHAMLRLAHADLILDELDSYDAESMIAVLRLVHVAAMFGRNVIISSATLSPSLAGYALRAYRAGMRVHRAMQCVTPAHGHVVMVSDTIDVSILDLDDNGFDIAYQDYLSRMAGAVHDKITKLFRIADIGETARTFLSEITDSAVRLHADNGWMMDGTKVSVGLVRVANIGTCIEVAEHLIQSDPRIHVVTYHSREPMLRRAFKEHHFDRILKRKTGSHELEMSMRSHLENCVHMEDAIFIVVATPVEEVGRDHDFDWGIIEPSSIHSIIQTCGRINRHRMIEVDLANIVVLNRCYRDVRKKYFEGKPGCVFAMPGNEIAIHGGTSHPEHEMTCLLGVGIGETHPLDGRLMFGSGRTLFAERDEASIRIRLGNVVSRYLESNGSLTWFGKWLGDAYPLRERSITETWCVLPFDRRKVEFHKYGLVQRAGAGGWLWTEQNKQDGKDAPDRAWLSPTVHKVAEFTRGLLGRDPRKEDMSFQIHVGQEVAGMDWRGVIVRRQDNQRRS